MEIKLNEETLKGKKLLCGVPMYGGMCYGTFMKSCLDLQAACSQYGVECNFSFLFNESLIQRARNYITDEFLRSNCTHMIFIDADVSFNPIDVIAMLAMDKEIIGGPYPKKCIKWSNIRKALMKNPNISDDELAVLGGDIVFNPAPGTTTFNVSELVEVMELGTGFLMMKREVFEKYQKAYPKRMYLPDHVGTQHFGGDREICSFFNVEIDPESRRTWSEDYMFCQECRKIGIKIWMAPFIQLQHTGTYTYQGSLPKVAQFLGEL
jgi:hypothetical protein